MQKLFIYLLDIIFPPSEDMKRVRAMYITQRVVHHYTPHKHKDVLTLTHFNHPDIRALIHEAKFHANTHAFRLLGTLLMHHLTQTQTHFDYIIPIPLSSARFRARGYNQVHEVLYHTSINKNIIKYDVLARIRDTRPQTELTRVERLTNIKNAFMVKKPETITGKHIMLLDDVTTTGTTLHAAKRALQMHSPASIVCVALAH